MINKKSIKKHMNLYRAEWGVLFVLAVVAILVFILLSPLKEWTTHSMTLLRDKESARTYILSYQPYSALYFIGLQVFQVIISLIPGELSGFVGGFIFGAGLGFLYSTLGLLLGSCVAVLIGRVFERVFLEKIIPQQVLDKFGSRIERWGLVSVFIFYLMPGVPKDYMCYLIGLTRLPVVPFILVSSMARMPGTLVLSLQGAKVFDGDWVFLIAFSLSALVVLVPLLVFSDRIQVFFGLKESRLE
ncbi:MAG: TVP38/TMEM64 family protein [Deltaproteobacteria bacterium]|nr:TVP38/TMEM64 family protein [Deltaproteobacteria bacterium]